MRTFFKGLGIFLLVLLIAVVVFVGFAILCRALDWLPGMTDWLTTNIFDKIGLTFFGKL